MNNMEMTVELNESDFYLLMLPNAEAISWLRTQTIAPILLLPDGCFVEENKADQLISAFENAGGLVNLKV